MRAFVPTSLTHRDQGSQAYLQGLRRATIFLSGFGLNLNYNLVQPMGVVERIVTIISDHVMVQVRTRTLGSNTRTFRYDVVTSFYMTSQFREVAVSRTVNRIIRGQVLFIGPVIRMNHRSTVVRARMVLRYPDLFRRQHRRDNNVPRFNLFVRVSVLHPFRRVTRGSLRTTKGQVGMGLRVRLVTTSSVVLRHVRTKGVGNSAVLVEASSTRGPHRIGVTMDSTQVVNITRRMVRPINVSLTKSRLRRLQVIMNLNSSDNGLVQRVQASPLRGPVSFNVQ